MANITTVIQRFPPQPGDEGVISMDVDVTADVLVDSMTNLSDTPVPPDLMVMLDDGSAEDGDDNSKLTLAYERLYELPVAIVQRFSDFVKYLDISHNKISNLDVLVHFKHLTSLIADHNLITENCFLPHMPQLQLLWLNHCKISALHPWVTRLKASCPGLQYLCLMGNPAAPSYLNGGTFYEYLQYRLFVIAQIPSLNHLDDRKVTEDQRAEAHRLFKRPFLQRLVSRNGALPDIVQSSVSWSKVVDKFSAFWGKDRRERNLFI